MKWLWTLAKYTVSFLALVGLVFSSGVFSVLLYAKFTGKEWEISYSQTSSVAYAEISPSLTPAAEAPIPKPPAPKQISAMIQAPAIRQHPELPSGCEITSLTMLFQYYGIEKSKMELVPEMKKDPTPMQRGADGTITYWGNPNTGFVGDATGRSRGFGIYHAALFELLKKYIPSGVDLTGGDFDAIEKHVSNGTPVVIWTTVDFNPPTKWVVWDTPTGPIKTTFQEHAVLLVGYDEQQVFVNDPWTGKAQVAINKQQFIKTWEAMGKQAISYNKAD